MVNLTLEQAGLYLFGNLLGNKYRVWQWHDRVPALPTKYAWPDPWQLALLTLPMYSPLNIPASASAPFTDYSRWRLLVSDGGRHTWHYLQTDEQCAQWPQNAVDKFWLGIPLVGMTVLF